MFTRKSFLTLFALVLLVPAAGAFARDAGKAAKTPKSAKMEKGEGHEHGKEEGGECKKHDGCCKAHCGKMGMMDASTAVIVKHKVKDYDAWRKAFDAESDMKDKGGVVMAHVFQSPSDPTDVTVIARFKDEASAKAFTSSPELKAAMEKSGVVGEPQITILKDVTGAMCPHCAAGECGKGPRDGSGPMGGTNECPRHKEMMDKGGDKPAETPKDEPKKDEKKTDKK